MAVEEFEFDFDGYERYAWLIGWIPWFGRWYMTKRRENTRCWLDNATLHVEKGVVFRRRHAIPVVQIADVLLIQGPYMARFGLWTTVVKTTSSWAVVSLVALKDPEGARDRLLGAAHERNRGDDPPEAD